MCNNIEERKWLMDWKYGKIEGILQTFVDQKIITKRMYDTLYLLVHDTDMYREALERELKWEKEKKDV